MSRVVGVVSGSACSIDCIDGVASSAKLKGPMGIVLVGSTLFIADELGNSIRTWNMVTDMVTTVTGATDRTLGECCHTVFTSWGILRSDVCFMCSLSCWPVGAVAIILNRHIGRR